MLSNDPQLLITNVFLELMSLLKYFLKSSVININAFELTTAKDSRY